LWSAAISQVPSIRLPSPVKVAVKRWENSNGEKSGAATGIPADRGQPVRRLGNRHRPPLDQERLVAQPLERDPGADIGQLRRSRLARHHERHAPLTDQRLQPLVFLRGLRHRILLPGTMSTWIQEARRQLMWRLRNRST
jgi:hypothetical protein